VVFRSEGDPMKPGDLIRVVRGPSKSRSDSNEPWCWLWKEMNHGEKPQTIGRFMKNDIGLVLEVFIRQRWAKVQVGDKIGWIDADHMEVIE